MFQTPDETVLKLYTSCDGHVWHVKGINPAVNSAQQPTAFLASSAVSGLGLTVRVLGIRQNAELISELYLRRHKGEIRAVEVAGPNVLHTAAELADPVLVLQRMRAVEVGAARGGWHVLSMNDYLTYAMLARQTSTAQDPCNFVFDESAKAYFNIHPVRRALSFIPTLSESHAAELLAHIIDPRWYVDRRAPDRSAKLELYLGLTPRIQNQVENTQCPLSNNRQRRAATTLAAWRTAEPAELDLQDPANFLYRIQRVAGGTKGDLRASQAFVRYLRHNWLAALETRQGVKDGLFAPDLFFKTPAEVAAFKEHMKQAK